MKVQVFSRVFVVCFFLLTGCESNYEDVSNDVKYRHLVGDKYQLLSPLWIYGITDGHYQNKVIDKYIITNFVFDGNEIITRGRLRRGDILEVIKIRSCINCYFQELIDYEVTLLSGSAYKDVPISISDIRNDLSVNNSKDKIELDPSIFKRI